MLNALLLLLLTLNSALASQMVAVLEFNGLGVNDAVLKKLADSSRVAVRSALPKDDFDIMTRENLEQILADNEIDSRCIKDSCEVETGRYIGADLIIAGEVLLLEGQYLMTLKLFSTDKGKLLSAIELEASKALDLVHEVPVSTRALLRQGLSVKLRAEQTKTGGSSSRREGSGKPSKTMLSSIFADDYFFINFAGADFSLLGTDFSVLSANGSVPLPGVVGSQLGLLLPDLRLSFLRVHRSWEGELSTSFLPIGLGYCICDDGLDFALQPYVQLDWLNYRSTNTGLSTELGALGGTLAVDFGFYDSVFWSEELISLLLGVEAQVIDGQLMTSPFVGLSVGWGYVY